MRIVIGDIVLIMTKSLSADIASAFSWDQFIKLSEDSLQQIHFWRDNLCSLNRRNLFEAVQNRGLVYSDASSEGYGGMSLVQLMAYLMGHGL